jgi:hypothetical protein
LGSYAPSIRKIMHAINLACTALNLFINLNARYQAYFVVMIFLLARNHYIYIYIEGTKEGSNRTRQLGEEN